MTLRTSRTIRTLRTMRTLRTSRKTRSLMGRTVMKIREPGESSGAREHGGAGVIFPLHKGTESGHGPLKVADHIRDISLPAILPCLPALPGGRHGNHHDAPAGSHKGLQPGHEIIRERRIHTSVMSHIQINNFILSLTTLARYPKAKPTHCDAHRQHSQLLQV